jgi:hypothetical protein
MQEVFQVPLGGGSLELEPKEALALRTLVRRDEKYGVLRKVMMAMNEAAKHELANVQSDLDTIRVNQGRLTALAELAHIIEVDVETWYEEGKSDTADEETA